MGPPAEVLPLRRAAVTISNDRADGYVDVVQVAAPIESCNLYCILNLRGPLDRIDAATAVSVTLL